MRTQWVNSGMYGRNPVKLDLDLLDRRYAEAAAAGIALTYNEFDNMQTGFSVTVPIGETTAKGRARIALSVPRLEWEIVEFGEARRKFQTLDAAQKALGVA